jgi:hypothetical protein
MTTAPVQLLWTGGWDSTFRLLCLVLVEQRQVQPIYLIDASRKSTGMELRTMAALRRELVRRQPETAARLLPTRFADISDLAPDPGILQSFVTLSSSGWRLASQHVWIAEYCRINQLTGIELCEERSLDPVPPGSFSRQAIKWLDLELSPPPLRRDAPAELLDLFGSLSFPLIHDTKPEMLEQARRLGFDDLLMLTWFCHHPHGRHPCGTCGPCRHTHKQGLGFRLRLAGRLRHRLFGLRQAIDRLLRKKTP